MILLSYEYGANNEKKAMDKLLSDDEVQAILAAFNGELSDRKKAIRDDGQTEYYQLDFFENDRIDPFDGV